MWAHYAEKHHGVCLGFDVPYDLVKKVIYRQSMLPYSFDLYLYRGGIDEKKMLKILYTKYSGWIYEDEMLVQVNLDN